MPLELIAPRRNPRGEMRQTKGDVVTLILENRCPLEEIVHKICFVAEKDNEQHSLFLNQ